MKEFYDDFKCWHCDEYGGVHMPEVNLELVEKKIAVTLKCDNCGNIAILVRELK